MAPFHGVAALGRRSLALDWALARSDVATALRWRFLAEEERVLPLLLRGQSATLHVGRSKCKLETTTDLGTLEACLVDVQSELVVPGVLDPRGSQPVVYVGANVGQFAAAVEFLSPGSHLVCFELDPIVFSSLARNVRQLPNVGARCLALGREDGVGRLFRHDLSVMFSLCPVGPGYDRDRTVSVDVACLDDVLVGEDCVDILKGDVEESELVVLQGATGVLRRTRFLLVEIGLSRDARGDNLGMMALVRLAVPSARSMRFGRPLGGVANPIAQDVLITLERPGVSPFTAGSP